MSYLNVQKYKAKTMKKHLITIRLAMYNAINKCHTTIEDRFFYLITVCESFTRGVIKMIESVSYIGIISIIC